MELLDPYIIYQGYQIHWINSILIGSFVIYFVLWLTLLTGFHKRANSFLEHYLRFLIVVPFWLLFVLNTIEFIVPNFSTIYLKQPISKKIDIINNSADEAGVSFWLENKADLTWKRIEPGIGWLSLDLFSVEKGKYKTAEIVLDTSKYSGVLIEYNIPSSDRTYGIKLRANDVPVKIFTDELKDEILLDLDRNFTYEYYKMLIFGFAIIFLWYHYGLIMRRKRRRRFLIFGGLLTLYCFFCLFILSRTVFFKDIFGI